MWPPWRVTAQWQREADSGREQRGSRTPRRLRLTAVLLHNIQIPNLLSVQREWFRQQIFWVTDFSNRPGAGSLGDALRTPVGWTGRRTCLQPVTEAIETAALGCLLARLGGMGVGSEAVTGPHLWAGSPTAPEWGALSNAGPWLLLVGWRNV